MTKPQNPFKKGKWVQHEGGTKGVVLWDFDKTSGILTTERKRVTITLEEFDKWKVIPNEEMPKRDWSKPNWKPTDAERAFPANALEYMPEPEEIPKEFWSGRGFHSAKAEPWVDFAGSYCVGCVDIETVEFGRKDGIDGEAAFTQINAIARSFAPKHEHKEATVAWLLSMWFTDVKWEKKLSPEMKAAMQRAGLGS